MHLLMFHATDFIPNHVPGFVLALDLLLHLA